MKPETQYRVVPERWGTVIVYYIYERGVNQWRLLTSEFFQTPDEAQVYLQNLLSAIKRVGTIAERHYDERGRRILYDR